jgi:hypothetical protein
MIAMVRMDAVATLTRRAMANSPVAALMDMIASDVAPTIRGRFTATR